MKRLLAFCMMLVMLISQISVCYAREVSTYDVLTNMDPGLLDRFRQGGLSDEMIQSFMGILDDEADKLQKPEDRETLEQYFLSLLLLYVFQQERFLPVMVAFDQHFPEEVVYIAETGRVPESLEIFFLSVMGKSIAYQPPQIEDDPGEEPPAESATPEPTVAPTPTPTPPFSDLEHYSWAVPSIVYLVEEGLLSGYPDGTFRPELPLSRAELAVLVSRGFLDQSYAYASSRFPDVTNDAWYSRELLTAEYFSIFQWIYEGAFIPEAPVTRQELCAAVYRAYRRNDTNPKRVVPRYDFLDFSQISGYAYDPIQQLQQADCIQGYSDGCFHPHKLATRAEAAKIIASVLQLP